MTWHDYIAAALIGLFGLAVIWAVITISGCVYINHEVTVIAVDNTTTAGVEYDRANTDD